MELNSICVCGAGTMGSGIAQAAAQKGLQVVLYDLDQSVLSRAKTNISNSLETLAAKGKITPGEKDSIVKKLAYSCEIGSCRGDIIIEAIIEKEEAKVNLLNSLAELNGDQCVLATNTSSLSVSAIARQVKNPSRVVGMHFFNPPTIMKLVEVVEHPALDPGVRDAVTNLAERLGKTPVLCQDHPGFIVNRVARPFYLESLRIAEEGITDFSTIDRILESAGFRMGPFRLMDLIGNDINYAVSCLVFDQLGKPPRLAPSSLQGQKVAEGKLGRKSGEGYYSYP